MNKVLMTVNRGNDCHSYVTHQTHRLRFTCILPTSTNGHKNHTVSTTMCMATSVCTEVLFRSKTKRTKRTEYRRAKLSLDEYDIENCWRREWPPVHLVDCPRIRINNHDFMCTHNHIKCHSRRIRRSVAVDSIRTKNTESTQRNDWKSCDSVRQAENDDDLGKSQFSYHRRTASIFIRHLDNAINFNVFISPNAISGDVCRTAYDMWLFMADWRPINDHHRHRHQHIFFCLSILNGFTINSTDQQP